MAEACIVHINLCHFWAQLAERSDPSLAGRAYAVGPAGQARGLALSVSPAAWREGLRPGMPLQALRRRGCALFEPDAAAAAEVRRTIRELCLRYTPRVEEAGDGHFYLDTRGCGRLFGPAADIAVALRDEIAQRCGLRAAVAAAANKLVAKLATRVGGPGAFVAVPAGQEAVFLARQDPGVLGLADPRLARQLAALEFEDLGAIADCEAAELRRLLGPVGGLLRAQAAGEDAAGVAAEAAESRRVEARRQFATDTNDPARLDACLARLAAEAIEALRGQGWSARRVSVAVEYSDGYRSVGELRLDKPLRLEGELDGHCRALRQRVVARRVRVRALALRLDNLDYAGSQNDLFPDPAELSRERLQRSIDRSRSRYGTGAVLPLSALAVD